MTNTPSLTQRLGWWAHALISMAQRGRHYSRDPHDQANYERLLKIAAEMRAVVDDTTPAQVETRIEQFGLGGPIPVADAAIFDADGRILLIQRADDKLWAMPGGGLDVGETPAEGACREAWEETGVTIRARALVGVYDSRRTSAGSTWHLYAFVFLCEPVSGEPGISHETLGVGWFDPDSLPLLSGGHARRIADAVAFYRAAQPVTYFDA